MEYLIIIGITVVIILIIAIIASVSGSRGSNDSHHSYNSSIFATPQKVAGMRGERAATAMIEAVLREDEFLFTNVSVSYEGRPAEFDNVIVNKFGVFIIEVKYYSGLLSGTEDCSEWTKVHYSEGGNLYVKSVRNPVPQVKREVYILANYLRHNGVSVWVDGYFMILGANSPVKNEYFLLNTGDIDRVIHSPRKQMLSADTVIAIKKLLS